MAAQLLFKAEIESLISKGDLLKAPAPGAVAGAPAVRNMSIDLTVGGILVPGADGDKLGSCNRPVTQISLEQGQTAVIRTAEKLALPQGIGAICFPPSSGVSLPGLLTTNPGVIDPGFTGPLHLTVINMGKANFPLKAGDRILRVLLFKDSSIVGAPSSEKADPITPEVLERLSPDFLNVEKRAEKAVAKAELRIKAATVLVPILVAVVAGFFGYLASNSQVKDRIVASEKETSSKIEAVKESIVQINARMETSSSLADVNERLKRLEARMPTRKNGSGN